MHDDLYIPISNSTDQHVWWAQTGVSLPLPATQHKQFLLHACEELLQAPPPSDGDPSVHRYCQSRLTAAAAEGRTQRADAGVALRIRVAGLALCTAATGALTLADDTRDDTGRLSAPDAGCGAPYGDNDAAAAAVGRRCGGTGSALAGRGRRTGLGAATDAADATRGRGSLDGGGVKAARPSATGLGLCWLSGERCGLGLPAWGEPRSGGVAGAAAAEVPARLADAARVGLTVVVVVVEAGAGRMGAALCARAGEGAAAAAASTRAFCAANAAAVAATCCAAPIALGSWLEYRPCRVGRTTGFSLLEGDAAAAAAAAPCRFAHGPSTVVTCGASSGWRSSAEVDGRRAGLLASSDVASSRSSGEYLSDSGGGGVCNTCKALTAPTAPRRSVVDPNRAWAERASKLCV
jgi:hypothetical protein